MARKTTQEVHVPAPTVDPDLFKEACELQIGLQKGLHGIGTLQEKTIHSVLKYYYAPDRRYHEVKIGSYVADICIEGEILEIQTRNFNTMRNKLSCFLEDHEVTIVYPVAHHKWISWLDPETGEITNKHKSPKTGNYYAIFRELYRIKMFLKQPNLHFIIPLIDVEETRYLNGWSKDKKKGSSRMDGIPTAIYDELRVNSFQDYLHFIPENIPEPFTCKDFQKAAHIPQWVASVALNILTEVECVKRIGKEKNAYLYTINKGL